MPLLPILLGPRLAPCTLLLLLSQRDACNYAAGAPELRDSPNLEAKSVTDPPFHCQEAVVGRRVPQPRLDPAQKQDGSPNEEED